MAIPRVFYDPVTVESSGGNVIQIVSKGIEYLRVGAMMSADRTLHLHHADVLKSLLEELGLRFEVQRESKYKMPLRKGQDYELVGAGECWINNDNTHDFYGGSAFYEDRINRGHLETLIPFFPEGISVRFGRYDNPIVLGVGQGKR